MPPYVVTGAGTIDLRGTNIGRDGLTFATSGNAVAQILSSQFHPLNEPLPLNVVITGNGFANTLEIFTVNHFDARNITFQSWNSAVDQVIFRGPGGGNVVGTTQRDLFDMGGGARSLYGLGGDDTAIYGKGEQRFEGGDGFDTLIADFSYVQTYALGSAGDFAADASGFSGQLYTGGRIEGAVVFTGVDRFQITGTKLDDNIRTGDNIDTVSGGAGNDIINSGRGADIIDGGAGNADRWIADKSGDSAATPLTLNVRTNTYSGPGSVTNIEAVNLILGAGNDTVITSTTPGLADTVIGGAGNDTASFALGEDRFEGGVGFDTLIADFSGTTTYGVSSGGEFAPDASGYSGQFFTGGRIEGAVVFTGVDRFQITGTQFADSIRTGDNNDTINGGAGNDIINSGKGVDVIDGGAGNADRWIADKSGDGAGTPLTLNVRTNTYSGPGSVTNIEAVNLILGAGNDTVITSTLAGLADTVIGGAGNDTASFALGEDRFEGGTGFDTLIADFSGTTTYGVNSSGDFAPDASGYSGQFFTGGRIEGAVVFTGVDRFQVTGTQFADTIRTGDNNDTINGGAGNDIINSGKGVDVIDGGAGNADRWIADKSGDSAATPLILNVRTNAYSGPGSVTNIEAVELRLGAGNDMVVTSTFAGLADTVIGGAGNDIAYFALGEDRFEGGTGVDTLVADFSGTTTYGVSSGGNFAPDASGYSGQFFTGGRIEGAVVFTGVERFHVVGTKFADTIRTGDNSDTVIGGAGNDVLMTGSGADTVDGGAGVDFWQADLSAFTGNFTYDARTATTQLIGNGVSVTGIERVDLKAGSGDDHFILGDLADSIHGGAGADTLEGGGGADTLAGGTGNDVYINPLGDTIIELSGQGFDRVISDSSFSLATLSNVERLELTGAVPGFLRGNNFANQLIGNSGSNTMLGFDGDDAIFGGGGRDTITGGMGRDQIAPGLERDTIVWNSVAESTGAGRDFVSEFVFSNGSAAYEMLDFHVVPTAVRATITTGSLNEANFDANLQAAVNASNLGAGQAVLFDPNGGDLNIAGHVYLIVDANGVAGYQAGQDYVVQFTSTYGTLTLANFI